jgi:hypothetical protein
MQIAQPLAPITYVAIACILIVACTSAPSSTGHECAAAGGTCVVGPGLGCALQAPSSAQDCNTNPPNPGGAVCCLASYSGESCAQRTTAAQSATIAALSQAAADLNCKTDSDCTAASDISTCWISCGATLNLDGAAKLQSAIAQINTTICATFVADGCEPNVAPPCAGFGAYCVGGQCQGFPGPPASDGGGAAGDGASE